MSVDEGVNAVFYISICTLLCTCMTLSVKYCYKSKCKEVKFCCIKITRDIETELKEDIQNPRESIKLDTPTNYYNNNK
jgi:hypothetical protein